jgi:hypothetical protein
MGPGSSVGMVGIPLGSTELGGGGLSPPSVALSPNSSAPVMSLLPPARDHPTLRSVPFDVAEHAPMPDDPDRCPHDPGNTDDVRSASDRRNPGQGGSNGLPLTSRGRSRISAVGARATSR